MAQAADSDLQQMLWWQMREECNLYMQTIILILYLSSDVTCLVRRCLEQPPHLFVILSAAPMVWCAALRQRRKCIWWMRRQISSLSASWSYHNMCLLLGGWLMDDGRWHPKCFLRVISISRSSVAWCVVCLQRELSSNKKTRLDSCYQLVVDRRAGKNQWHGAGEVVSHALEEQSNYVDNRISVVKDRKC
jgi:hypothetical protein